MSKKLFAYLVLPTLLLFCGATESSTAQPKNDGVSDGTLEKMMVANGVVIMKLDQNRINGIEAVAGKSAPTEVRFNVAPDSFFTVLVFNRELRSAEPGAMRLVPQGN